MRLTTTISSHKHNKCTHSSTHRQTDTQTHTRTDTHTHTHRHRHRHRHSTLARRGATLISWSWPVNGHYTYNCTQYTHRHRHTHYTLHITHYVYAAWHETSCCIVNYVLRAIRIRLSCRLSGPCKYNRIDKGLGKMKAEACEACRTFRARGKWQVASVALYTHIY